MILLLEEVWPPPRSCCETEVAQAEEHELLDELLPWRAWEVGTEEERAMETTSSVVDATIKGALSGAEELPLVALRGEQMLKLVEEGLELTALFNRDCSRREVRLTRLELGEKRKTVAVTRAAWSHDS